ncbi:hypothetical protein WBG78_27410 [Chryseolinea sp. T2]|uniref:hypothetical protein n=1 Tax=Chryseolinea sp. T2 TaxID=3129255 RepID=UPI003077750B
MRDRRTIFSVFGTLICLAIAVHVLLALIIIISPETSRVSPALKFYRRFVVLGPFFQQPRIGSKSHLMVSQQVNGTWSVPTDYACEDVANPHLSKNLALQRRAFEVFLTESVNHSRREADRTRALNELKMYLRTQERFRNADSINMVSIRRGFSDGVAGVDTVFQFRFRNR